MKNRHIEIIEALKKRPFITIEEFCLELDVSPATIRRDLSQLEETGEVLRINGGAIYNRQAGSEQPPAQLPQDPYINEKIRIAQAAAEMVRDGDTIFMDAGSTNQHIAEHLGNKERITVITNSLEIAHKLHNLKNKKDISIIICGGALGEANLDSIVGPVAETMISMFRANICFVGTSALDTKLGITDAYLASARIKEKMIEHSGKVYLVTDRSKFGVTNTAFVCPIDKISHVITDEQAPAEDVGYLRSRGITVTLV
ncbi:DeoR/GlpR family DNA-binding transcription regulator [Paenibacillus silvisoli]|uniref:DeoR/GlpR family DNA-binding transcription regulator n=1 Tax=Paenibacillus silvisoli TaxID=3110539 RepID=UPI0028062978|nr:DeoR/GlpR family DNA-binding transcription regulator [Paenibacillus silvisoli]